LNIIFLQLLDSCLSRPLLMGANAGYVPVIMMWSDDYQDRTAKKLTALLLMFLVQTARSF